MGSWCPTPWYMYWRVNGSQCPPSEMNSWSKRWVVDTGALTRTLPTCTKWRGHCSASSLAPLPPCRTCRHRQETVTGPVRRCVDRQRALARGQGAGDSAATLPTETAACRHVSAAAPTRDICCGTASERCVDSDTAEHCSSPPGYPVRTEIGMKRNGAVKVCGVYKTPTIFLSSKPTHSWLLAGIFWS